MADDVREIRREYVVAARRHYRRFGVLPSWANAALTKGERNKIIHEGEDDSGSPDNFMTEA